MQPAKKRGNIMLDTTEEKLAIIGIDAAQIDDADALIIKLQSEEQIDYADYQ